MNQRWRQVPGIVVAATFGAYLAGEIFLNRYDPIIGNFPRVAYEITTHSKNGSQLEYRVIRTSPMQDDTSAVGIEYTLNFDKKQPLSMRLFLDKPCPDGKRHYAKEFVAPSNQPSQSEAFRQLISSAEDFTRTGSFQKKYIEKCK